MLTHFLTFARVTNPPLLPPSLHLCSHTMFLSRIAISQQEIRVCSGVTDMREAGAPTTNHS